VVASPWRLRGYAGLWIIGGREVSYEFILSVKIFNPGNCRGLFVALGISKLQVSRNQLYKHAMALSTKHVTFRFH
jgi:hypothetical protein